MKSDSRQTQKSRYHRFPPSKPTDPAMVRLVIFAGGVGMGFLILLGGLFWTQVASGRHYGDYLEQQSIRRIRVPALRGSLYDRNELPLVDNRSLYNIVLYIEELRRFRKKGTVEETVRVARQTINEIAARLALSSPVTDEEIRQHTSQSLPLPLELWKNVPFEVVAGFAEKCSGLTGADLQVMSSRHYVYGPLAAHLLGYVQQTAYLKNQPRQEFDYFLPDMEGKDGLEQKFDETLRGSAGSQPVLIDAAGFRRRNLPGEPMQPGKNLILSLDAGIQFAVETALASQPAAGACVVLDPRNGDVLALASNPAFNPNWFSPGISSERWNQLSHSASKPLINRTIHEHYAPGSIFKIVVALAGLESGTITAASRVNCQGVFRFPSGVAKHCWALNGHGETDFLNSLKHSCDIFFYQHGIAMGPQSITNMAHRFCLGRRTEIDLPGEKPGIVPFDWHNWFDGDSANYAVGQGPVTVTPLQMAVMTAAVANGGHVVWPRLVLSTMTTDEMGKSLKIEEEFRPRFLGDLGVSAGSLELVRRAMFRVVEEADGTGHRAAVPGLKIAGKTGTAEVKVPGGVLHRVWFVAFAPYDSPRVALAIVLENGDSGGRTVAPLASQILARIFGTHPVSSQERSRVETQGD